VMLVTQKLNATNRQIAADLDLRTHCGMLHNTEPVLTLVAIYGTLLKDTLWQNTRRFGSSSASKSS
jgi:hypothetical protein